VVFLDIWNDDTRARDNVSAATQIRAYVFSPLAQICGVIGPRPSRKTNDNRNGQDRPPQHSIQLHFGPPVNVGALETHELLQSVQCPDYLLFVENPLPGRDYRTRSFDDRLGHHSQTKTNVGVKGEVPEH
jgi:hypothetical protein